MLIPTSEIDRLKLFSYYRYKLWQLLEWQKECHGTARKLNERINEYTILIQDIRKTIESVPNDILRAILYMRYEFCLDWETIGEELGYCREHAIRMHRRALDEYEAVKIKNCVHFSVS